MGSSKKKKYDYLIIIPWECRNLGRHSFSLTQSFFKIPDFDKLEKEIGKLKYQYKRLFIQARIDKRYLLYAYHLERIGFCFIETTLIPYIRLNKSEVLDRFEGDPQTCIPQKYYNAGLTFRTLSRDNTFPIGILHTIAVESFSDDRFHLDHNCPPEVADRRFSYWVDDLIADKRVVFDVLELNGYPIGFMAHKYNYLILAGFARRFINAGLGSYLWLSTCRKLRQLGYTKAEALISVNNVSVMNLYCRLGFKFKNPQNTFHYWGDTVHTVSAR